MLPYPPPPAFWPPCNLQNVMACRRNDRTCIQSRQQKTRKHVSVIVCYITAPIFGSLLSLFHALLNIIIVVLVFWIEFEHYFEHLTQFMNKPISCLFVFSVVYCVVFRQKLKKTRQKQRNTKRNKKKSKKKTLEKNKQKIQNIQPTTRPRRNISQVLAGWAVFLCCCFSLRLFACACCSFVLLCLPGLFKRLHVKRKTHVKTEKK